MNPIVLNPVCTWIVWDGEKVKGRYSHRETAERQMSPGDTLYLEVLEYAEVTNDALYRIQDGDWEVVFRADKDWMQRVLMDRPVIWPEDLDGFVHLNPDFVTFLTDDPVQVARHKQTFDPRKHLEKGFFLKGSRGLQKRKETERFLRRWRGED